MRINKQLNIHQLVGTMQSDREHFLKNTLVYIDLFVWSMRFESASLLRLHHWDTLRHDRKLRFTV